MKDVRTPDENLIKGFYQDQLLNPLLKHLVGLPVEVNGTTHEQIPVKIVLRRISKVDQTEVPTQDEDTRITDVRLQENKGQLEAGLIKQKDTENQSIGA